ncbi:NAD(P)-dependent dehydrogenase (short-subunit alcohol dehydrogenase family) [Diaminobutyricimonas aerilata]|uniref:NAD(P)-dependent dehydrogenase (Short-subunit alcohol dehydrogenase family) n=1 Tax=Diaminobutyricimonas aerilata TaxID=1162967 RepID=A0A2M9CNZ1_9MICO|nr:SDR family NAD(P)-dependent oxidoreductase [Diaminobutyricimonas aerilata]PJJ73611.1 NAD(P)-dependent dehydrogenase (short-subunit alcohol dehydrogenase family) [Diaminobutyricimonas aerilata]
MEIEGRTVVLTGATSGIGAAAARRLAAEAGHLIVQGPESEAEVGELLAELRSAGRASVDYVSADFTSFAEVRSAARRVLDLADGIDVLVNNAGVPGSRRRQLTADGHERTIQVNYLALTLWSELLIPGMSDGGRIVNVGSTTHRMTSLALDDLDLEHGYDPVRAYAQSKLAIVTYSAWLASRLPRDISVVAISPGVISTSLLHSMFGGGGAPVEHGGARIREAVLADVPSGTYIDDGEVIAASDDALDEHTQAGLADLTRRLTS